LNASSRTREHISRVSLALFNEQGERSVSTNHIAAAAGISTGNLYYHFANKHRIVARLFDGYQARVSNALLAHPDTPCGIERLRQCLGKVIAAIWDYRFIYRDLEHLVQADPALAASHRAFSMACLREGRHLLEHLCHCGLLRMTAQEQQSVAINAWLILTSWVRYLYTTLPSPAAVSPAAVQRGAWQALSLLQHYALPHPAGWITELMAAFKGNAHSDGAARTCVSRVELHSEL
jgi:AcrR family transcriptional regulator